MSGTGRYLLVALRRCVAFRQLTTLTANRTRSFVHTQAWTTGPRANCLRGSSTSQPAATSSKLCFSSEAGTPCEDEYPPLPAYEPVSRPESKEVYIVQVKGLPWSCTTQDLLQFFSECRIRDGEKGIHLTPDRMGRPSGQAFIEMEHEEDVSKALEKHRQYLGQRYVEVFEVTNSDAEVILKKAAVARPEDGVVMLRGLPFTCTDNDIRDFFSDLDIVENGITMVSDSRGRKSGEAFVQFSSQEEAERALQKHRERIGHRYIEVFPSSLEDIQSGWRSRRRSASPPTGSRRSLSASQSSNRAASPRMSDLPPHYIHMRGLPFQVTGEDIVKFFFPLRISKILIECGADGRPSGEADVYFVSHKDSVDAMSRDRMHMGHRYIELFLNSAPGCEGDAPN